MTLEDFKQNPRTMYTAQEYERLLSAKAEAESLLEDADMKELAKANKLYNEKIAQEKHDARAREKEERDQLKADVIG